jgi:hypothetical protein
MGAYCFRIQEGLCHRIGSLLPEENESPKYAQIYIYDSSENSHRAPLSNRLSVVSHINRQTLDMLQSVMININPYVNAFKNMMEFVDRNPELVSDVRFVLKAESTPDPRRYNAPSDENEIAVLILGSGNEQSEGNECSSRDIVLRPQNSGMLQRINEKNYSYGAFKLCNSFSSR